MKPGTKIAVGALTLGVALHPRIRQKLSDIFFNYKQRREADKRGNLDATAAETIRQLNVDADALLARARPQVGGNPKTEAELRRLQAAVGELYCWVNAAQESAAARQL